MTLKQDGVSIFKGRNRKLLGIRVPSIFLNEHSEICHVTNRCVFLLQLDGNDPEVI